jgi:DNA repair exonuclease SbcCD ATPase subunit
LSFQVTALTEKCRQLTSDLEASRAQYKSLKESFDDLRRSHDRLTVELDASSVIRDQLNTNLSDRTVEIGRLVRTFDAACAELATIKSAKEMLAVQLEEREKNFLLLKEQCDQLRSSCEAYSQRECALIRERDELDRLLRDKSAELRAVIAEKESSFQRQISGEDRIKSLEESKRQLLADLTDKQAEFSATERVNIGLTSELREAKYELSNLKDQNISLQRVLEQREGNLGHELNVLTKKLQGWFVN